MIRLERNFLYHSLQSRAKRIRVERRYARAIQARSLVAARRRRNLMLKRFAGSARGALQEKAPLASYCLVMTITEKAPVALFRRYCDETLFCGIVMGTLFRRYCVEYIKACTDFGNLYRVIRKSVTGAFPRIILFELLTLENLFFLKKGFQTFQKSACVIGFRRLRAATKLRAWIARA